MKRNKANQFSQTNKALLRLAGILILVLVLFIGLPSCKHKAAGPGKKQSWLSRIFKSKGRSGVYSKEIGKVIEAARSYTGTPHRDGGTNRFGIDCSALIQNSFQAAGFTMPRTSRQQSETGTPVDRRNLRPGDLIFFSDRKIGSGITHVGLVTEILPDGDVKFIHTSSKLGVTENLLSTSYFTKTYAKAMRPF
jgi:cell wall-associated NlpC family hydrolase